MADIIKLYDNTVVNILEDLLEQAKNGEIVSIIGAAILNNENENVVSFHANTTIRDHHLMLGYLEEQRVKLIMESFE